MEKLDPNQKFPFAEFTIAMGFFILLAIEQIMSDAREQEATRSERRAILNAETGPETSTVEEENIRQNSSIRAFAMTFALSVHSVFEGIAIGVQTTIEDVIQVNREKIKIRITI